VEIDKSGRFKTGTGRPFPLGRDKVFITARFNEGLLIKLQIGIVSIYGNLSFKNLSAILFFAQN
jgi:hypothetical protein